MKTIEEKAKRYDEAYKVAESIHRFSSNPAEIKRMEEIFPSLKEYEGERIRNVLIGWINLESSISFGDTFDGFSKEQILAWLEKQGKPVEINPTEFDLQLNKLLKQFETLPKEELINSLNFYLNVVQNNGTYKEKKQCEKPQGKSAVGAINEEKVDNQNCVKPSIKDEPKFRVGDWCIDNEDGTIFQIVKVLDNSYKYRTNEGKEYSCTHYSLELDARLWTISDARDGDVLVASDGSIFLFAGIVDCACKYYAALATDDYVKINKEAKGGYWETSRAVYPATKEQHDKLEKSMADAGYSFDFEKKELKKIKQKPPIVNFKARDWDVSKVDGKIYNTKFMEEPLTNQKRRLEIEKAAMSATGIIEQEEWFIKGAEWSDKNPSYISSEKQGEQKYFDYENANIP